VVLRGGVYQIMGEISAFVQGKERGGWVFWAEEESLGRNPQYMKVALAARPVGEAEGKDYVALVTLTEQPEGHLFLRVPPRDSWDFRARERVREREALVIYRDHLFCQRAPPELGLRLIEEMLNDFWRRGIAVSPVRIDPARPMGRRG
jgi:hypothetical protein